MMNTDRIYYSREAEEQAQQERTMLALLVLVLGFGIGSAVALLVTHRTQQQHRNRGILYRAGRVLENLPIDFDKLPLRR